MFFAVLASLFSLFICMGLGFLLRRLRVLDDIITSGLSKVLLYAAMPCTVFLSLQREFSAELLGESVVAFAVGGASFLVSFALSNALVVLFRAKDEEKGVWKFTLTFANVGYAGFPIMMAVYGQEAMIYTSMVTAAFNILAYSLGVYIYAGKNKAGGKERLGGLKPVLRNPALISVAVGLVFFIFSLRIPDFLSAAALQFSNMTTPLSMIIVGSILGKCRIAKVFGDAKVYVITAFRLIVFPVALYFILRPFIENKLTLGVLVYLIGMPAASLTVILADEHRGNTELASRAVFVSTLLSIVTIPGLSLLINN